MNPWSLKIDPQKTPKRPPPKTHPANEIDDRERTPPPPRRRRGRRSGGGGRGGRGRDDDGRKPADGGGGGGGGSGDGSGPQAKSKTPDGKPLNAFGHGEECLGAAEATHVIEETHGFWKALRAGKADPGKLWVGN